MLLRRFMHHVKDQNWFAVGLDVVVVIVGIFLGMQVTEWNDARKVKSLDKETVVLLRKMRKGLEYEAMNFLNKEVAVADAKVLR